MTEYTIKSKRDLDNMTGVFTVIESGETLDIADIRFGYDGQTITLESVD